MSGPEQLSMLMIFQVVMTLTEDLTVGWPLYVPYEKYPSFIPN